MSDFAATFEGSAFGRRFRFRENGTNRDGTPLLA